MSPLKQRRRKVRNVVTGTGVGMLAALWGVVAFAGKGVAATTQTTASSTDAAETTQSTEATEGSTWSEPSTATEDTAPAVTSSQS